MITMFNDLKGKNDSIVTSMLEFADELYRNDLSKEADVVQYILKKNAESDDEDDDENNESELHDMSLKDLVSKVNLDAPVGNTRQALEELNQIYLNNLNISPV